MSYTFSKQCFHFHDPVVHDFTRKKVIVQVINEQDAKSAVLVGFYSNFCNFIQVLHMVVVKL